MPRYTVSLIETANYFVTVDASTPEEAKDAAEEVFIDANNIAVFPVGDIDRNGDEVTLADDGEALSADHPFYHMTAARSPVEAAAPDMLAALKRMVAAHDADVAAGSLIAAGNGNAADEARAAIAKAEGSP